MSFDVRQEALDEMLNELEVDLQSKKQTNKRYTKIQQEPWTKVTSFWCDECHRDYNLIAHKKVVRYKDEIRAVYEARCLNDHEVTRHITDIHSDPYWLRSRSIRALRREYERDMIQRTDPRFRMLYGDPNKAENDRKEAEERNKFNNRDSSHKGAIYL